MLLEFLFRVFMTAICLNPTKVQIVAMAYCSLHNSLRDTNGAQDVYTPEGSYDTEDTTTHDIIDGEWRDTQQMWQPIERQSSNRASDDAKATCICEIRAPLSAAACSALAPVFLKMHSTMYFLLKPLELTHEWNFALISLIDRSSLQTIQDHKQNSICSTLLTQIKNIFKTDAKRMME